MDFVVVVVYIQKSVFLDTLTISPLDIFNMFLLCWQQLMSIGFGRRGEAVKFTGVSIEGASFAATKINYR